jgi:hypothetical protein
MKGNVDFDLETKNILHVGRLAMELSGKVYAVENLTNVPDVIQAHERLW